MSIPIEVKNYTEVLVENQLDEIIQKEGVCCNCLKCKADIKAIALNNLPTKYVATPKGVCYAKLDSYKVQTMIDITTAILNAIKIVAKYPRHNEE